MEIKYQPISKNLMDKINPMKKGAADKTHPKGLIAWQHENRNIRERIGQVGYAVSSKKGVCEMAQWVKCLPCEHRGPRLAPQNPYQNAWNPGPEDTETSASLGLALVAKFQTNRDPDTKNKYTNA